MITLKNNKRLIQFFRKHRDLLEFALFWRRVTFRTIFLVNHFLLIRSYLQNSKIAKKLYLGCGFHELKGWLNSDLNPGKSIIFLDFTKKFPFPDNSFDYLFSEHAIEHIPLLSAKDMLAEAFRVMKPGAKIRIATPDFANILKLYQTKKTKTQQKYINWSVSSFQPNIPYMTDTVVINNFFRDWGHQFVYDEKMLGQVLKDAGFTKVKRCQPSQSTDKHLRGIDSHGKIIGHDFNKLESLILEATKPA